jgi:hypothetical protein
MESSSSRGEEGWTNGLILQTMAAHLTKMKHWTRFKKDAPVAWYSYNYKFFGRTSHEEEYEGRLCLYNADM